MPPRKEVGLTRMHAALDAMCPMGFPSSLVRKCLKNLLKAYGNFGWAFIEADAYKVLIEAILEEEELHKTLPENDQQKPVAIEAGDGKEGGLLLQDCKMEESNRRKPCHGWIGAEDDNDFVYLTPLDPHGFDSPSESDVPESQASVSALNSRVPDQLKRRRSDRMAKPQAWFHGPLKPNPPSPNPKP